MVVGNRRIPQSFQSVPPRLLLRRVEEAHRHEAEIVSLLGDALTLEVDTRPGEVVSLPGVGARARLLCGAFRTTHPALGELANARTSATVVVPPLATPPSYRHGLARTIGRLAHQGVHVRLITDALPGDYRFAHGMRREAGGSAATVEVRHVGPLGAHFYCIDRHRVVLLPVVGSSHRRPPVGLLLSDPVQVRGLMARFESLWSVASGTVDAPRRTRELVARARWESPDLGPLGSPSLS
jgi:hypothetical protein